MKKLFIAIGALVTPFLASAQGYVAGGPTLFDLTTIATRILNWLPRTLLAVAVLWFMWNIVKWIKEKASGDPKEAQNIFKQVLYSLALIFLMLAWQGGVALLSSSSGISIGGELDPNLVPSVTVTDPIFG